MDQTIVGILAFLVLIASIFRGQARKAKQRMFENPMEARRRFWG